MSPIKIDSTKYYPASEIIKELRISRQTLWRWRNEGKVPVGQLYRGKQIIFTAEEAETIRQFANRIEPLDEIDTNQLKLFNSNR
jgi:predicted DNA-binding protein (UPF0251 family)